MQQSELTRSERGRLLHRLAIRCGLVAIVILAIAFVVVPLLKYLLPFVLAFVVAWILHPLVGRVRKRVNISRRVLSLIFVLLIVLIAGAILSFFVYTIIDQIVALVNNWSAVADASAIIGSEGDILSFITGLLPAQVRDSAQSIITELWNWLQGVLLSVMSSITSAAGGFIKGVPSFFIALIVFITASYFITADYPSIREKAVSLFKGGLGDFFGFVKSSTLAAFSGYLRAQVILSIGVFMILLIGFLICGQGYALLIAFALAIMDFIPLIGSGTVLVPWAVIELITSDFRSAVELMVIWGIVILFRRVLEPKILGSQTGLSPLLSLMSIYVGMQLGGVLGMVLGPVILQVIIKIVESGLFSGLMSDLKLLVGDCVAVLRGPAKR